MSSRVSGAHSRARTTATSSMRPLQSIVGRHARHELGDGASAHEAHRRLRAVTAAEAVAVCSSALEHTNVRSHRCAGKLCSRGDIYSIAQHARKARVCMGSKIRLGRGLVKGLRKDKISYSALARLTQAPARVGRVSEYRR